MAINLQPTIQPRIVTGIFTKYIAKTLPLAFDESMSYYECICALLEYLNKTIVPDINNTNEGLSELQNFYLQLQDYVNNFDRELPEYVNDKLDEMASDGTLENLLNDAAHLTKSYDTYTDMISDSSTFTNGLRLKTLGYYNVNDGGGADYYVTSTANSNYFQVQLENNLYLTLNANNEINVKQLGAKGDDTNDDYLPFQNAVNLFKKIIIPKGTYYISDTISITKGDIEIIGDDATLTAHDSISLFVNDTNYNIKNINFTNITFLGNCYNDLDITHYPKRNRTFKIAEYNNGIISAIILRGKNYKRTSYSNSCENITINNCKFLDIYGLPVQLNGCDNVKFINNYVENSMDSGFVDTYNLIIDNNIIFKSADNGLSISSGCKRVTCTNNNINYSCIAGIWISGWKADGVMYYGPTDVVISNNILTNSGRCGIMGKWVINDVIITDNLIDTCLLNYKDFATNADNAEGGIGILLAGWSGTTIIDGVETNVTAISHNVNVSNNRIKNCHRNGIYLERITHFNINNNIFENLGYKTHRDGTTITSSETKYNNGIYIVNYDLTLDSNANIFMNTFKETRDDKLSFNYLNYKYCLSQAINIKFKDNIFYDYDDKDFYTYGNIKDTLKIDDYLSTKDNTNLISPPSTITTASDLYTWVNSRLEYSYNKAYLIKLSNTLLGDMINFSGSSGLGIWYKLSNAITLLFIFLPTSGITYTCRYNAGVIDKITQFTGTDITP